MASTKGSSAGNFRARNRCLDHDRPRANLDSSFDRPMSLHPAAPRLVVGHGDESATVAQLIRLEHESRDCLDPCPAPAGGAQRLLKQRQGNHRLLDASPQHLAADLHVVERMADAPDLLVRLMAFACHHNGILGPGLE